MSTVEQNPSGGTGHRARLALAGILALALVGLLAAAVFFPPLQLQAAVWILGRSGATDIAVEGLRVRPVWIRASQLRFRRNGITYDLHDIAAAFRPWQLLRHEADIALLRIGSSNITVDLGPAAGATSAGPVAPGSEPDSPASTGSFPAYQLPWRVRLETVHADGRLTVRQAGKPAGDCAWSIRGALQPAGKAHLDLDVRPAGPLFAEADGSRGSASLWIDQEPSGKVTGFRLAGEVLLTEGATVSWDGHCSGAGSSVHLSAHALPLSWVAAYLPKSVALPSGTVSGNWNLQFSRGLVQAGSDGVTVVDAAPWHAELTGNAAFDLPAKRLRLDAFQADVRRPPALLRLRLAQPCTVTTSAGFELPGRFLTADLESLPLEWFNPWLQGRHLSGQLATAQAELGGAGPGSYVVTGTAPWQAQQVVFSIGARQEFAGDVIATPEIRYGPSEQWARLHDISIQDTHGDQITGRAGLAWKTQDEHVGGGIDLQVVLPHFPGLSAKTGRYQVNVSAAAHVTSDRTYTLSHLAVSLDGRAGERLASFLAGSPVTLRRSDDGEWLLQSAQPLKMATSQVPLSGLNPALAARGLSLDGVVPASSADVFLEPHQIRVVPRTRLELQQLRLLQGSDVLIEQGLVELEPALTVKLGHPVLPKSFSHSNVDLGLDHCVFANGSVRLGRFDLHLSAEGNDLLFSPTDASGGCWLDLGALGRLPLLSDWRLPREGHARLVFGSAAPPAKAIEFHGAVEDLVGRDGQPAPALRITGRAGGDVAQHFGGFGVTGYFDPPSTTARPHPRRSDFHFGFRLDYTHLSISSITSKLTGQYLNGDDVRAFAAAFSPARPPAVPTPPTPAKDEPVAAAQQPPPASPPPPVAGPVAAESPPWGSVRGRFTLALDEVEFPPYVITHLAGTLAADPHQLALTGLSGDLLGGHWSADVAASDSGAEADRDLLRAHFALQQLDIAQAMKLRYSTPPPAGMEGRINLQFDAGGQAARWEELPAAITGTFQLHAESGRLRLALPKQETLSSALWLGGTLTFSKEMRALGRLLKTLDSVPLNQVEADGNLRPDGELRLQNLHINSPQLRIDAQGKIANAKTRDLLEQPLALETVFSARGDLAVILDSMHLLDQQVVGGFRALHEPVPVGGYVGQPDLQGFYDLLARAVQGSHGSWALLMKAVQSHATAK